MKVLNLFLIVILNAYIVYSQMPTSFNYQAVVRDGSGNILSNQMVSFQISILGGSADGSPYYIETHTGKITNTFGLVELEIGKGNSNVGSFTNINWGNNNYFIKVEMDPAGGTAFQHLGTSQLLSVPYALYAKDVQNNDDEDPDPLNELQELTIEGNNLTLSKNGGTVNLPSASGDNWGTDYVRTDASLSGKGSIADPLKIADSGISGIKLASGVVTTDKIGINAVTIDKLPAGASASTYLRGDGLWATPVTNAGGENGNVQFNNSGSFGGSPNLFWDNTNQRLGIRVPAPSRTLDIAGNFRVTGNMELYSVYSETSYSTGYGVYSLAKSTTGKNYGVYGGSLSSSGTGVLGYASSATGSTFGVYGYTAANNGRGVFGTANSSSGTTFGVMGNVVSPDGFSGYFSGGKFYVQQKAGFGDESPEATLDVEGTMVVGSQGKIFSEIREITGTTSGNLTYVSYPSGYSKDNTRVLSAEVNFNGTRWDTLGVSYSLDTPLNVGCGLTSSYIELYTPVNSNYYNKPFRLLLLKVQ